MMPASDFPSAEILGHRRALACLPSDPAALAREPRYGAAHPVPPVSEVTSWLEAHGGHLDLAARADSPVIDQRDCNGCAGWSATSAFNLDWNLGNQESHTFSAAFQYAQVNRGVDQGSTPLDNLQSLRSTGICLASDNPSGAIYAARLPRACYDSARRFRVAQAYQVATPGEMIGALALGRPVGFGMAIPLDYQTIDQSTGMWAGGGVGGLHGMMARGLLIHPATGRLAFVVQNSWSARWGVADATRFGWPMAGDLAGCLFVDPDAVFGGPYFEGYTLVSALLDTQSPEPVQQ